MSSHHIVKEKQEPALFILDFDGFDEEYFGQLLEWSPTLIVTESCYEEIASMSIKIDAVICENNDSIHFQESIRFIYKSNSQSFLEKGMAFLIKEGYPAVNVICKHFNAVNFTGYIDKINTVIFANHKKYYPIKSGFNKWSLKNCSIEVFNGEPFEYYGLQKGNTNNFITLKDGFYGFTFEKKHLFIAEDL